MKLNVWHLTPKLCLHGKRKTTRLTTLARDDEKPRPHLLVEAHCHRGCPDQLYELPKKEDQ